jgi:hypothetical protein
MEHHLVGLSLDAKGTKMSSIPGKWYSHGRPVWITISMLAAAIAYSVVGPNSADTSRVIAPAAADKYTTFDVQPGGGCNLDHVTVDGDDVTLFGWAILSSDADKPPPERVLLQLDVNGSSRRVVAQRIKRLDVAVANNNDALKMSGFRAVVTRQAGMKIKILQAIEGHLYECPDAFSADSVMAENLEQDAPGEIQITAAEVRQSGAE